MKMVKMHDIKYIIGTPNSVVVDSSKFEDLCRTGCRVYNQKWSCPPHSGGFLINQWIPFHVVILWIPNTIEAKNEYTKVKAINSILKSRLYRLLAQYPNKKVLGSGSCRLCQHCAYPEPCKHPDKMIYSMESFGIDVSLVCKALGHTLNWYEKGKPYEYGSVVGLIGDNNKDKIESRLRKILFDEKVTESKQMANTVML
jgi:predicted metal-binding protein